MKIAQTPSHPTRICSDFCLRVSFLLVAFWSVGAVAQRPTDKPALGRWDDVAPSAPRLSDVDPAAIEELNALGYLGASEPAPPSISVTQYDREKAFDGYNLCISGHGQECYLMNMEGRVLHRWTYDYPSHFPDRELRYNNVWFMCHVFRNGDLVVLQDGYGIFRFERISSPA